MITAITNTTSRNISGTSYYSDGCLYTTSYSNQTTTEIPYVSTVTTTGTYWTSSVDTATKTTYLGDKTYTYRWGPIWPITRSSEGTSTLSTLPDVNNTFAYSYSRDSVFGVLLQSKDVVEIKAVKCITSTLYTWLDGNERIYGNTTETFATTYSDGIWFTTCFHSRLTTACPAMPTFNITGSRYTENVKLSSFTLSLKKSSTTYTLSFSDFNEVGSYTSGEGRYGTHVGRGPLYNNNMEYYTFDYINEYGTVYDTYTSRNATTKSGTITTAYKTANTTSTLYPSATYTISSFFNDYNVSTSEKVVVDQYTNTIAATGSVPSVRSGLSVEYHVYGTCSTEMNLNDNRGRDRRYTTTNYFSVYNQRDKSYLISMANRNYAYASGRHLGNEDISCYVINPYAKRFIGTEMKEEPFEIMRDGKVEEVKIKTAFYKEFGRYAIMDMPKNQPYYGLSIYEVQSWNQTSWEPKPDFVGDYTQRHSFNDTISGVTLGSLVYSTSTIVPNGHTAKSSGWLFDRESWINQEQTFTAVSTVYVDTVTVPINYNGYGIMTYDVSYNITETYPCARTHFVTGE